MYLAKIAELPGIMADEPTRAEAARQMEEALEFALATAEELGQPLPEPSRLSQAA